MNILSLKPKPTLKGKKYPAAIININYVVNAKTMKVFPRPCVTNESFLVLQTNELKI